MSGKILGPIHVHATALKETQTQPAAAAAAAAECSVDLCYVTCNHAYGKLSKQTCGFSLFTIIRFHYHELYTAKIER